MRPRADSSLLLLALTMILLMTPAPYHRLAEDGETTHFERVGITFVLTALVPLALALAGDFYVVLETALQNAQVALFGALASVGCALVLVRCTAPGVSPNTSESRDRARGEF